MNNKLTDENFWSNYWKGYEPEKITNIFFEKLLDKLDLKGELLEIGGFPGRYAVYFNKIKKLDVTILDAYIDTEIVRRLEKVNDLYDGTIKTIQCDFLSSNITSTFDIVCSFGFLEHFKDADLVLNKHIELLKHNGLLLINIPNFCGVNGFVQYWFDRRNYMVHNIQIMKLNFLKSLCSKNNLKNVKVFYYGKPRLWLEPDAKVTSITKQVINIFSKIIRKIPFNENRMLAPTIFIIANK